LRNGRNPNASGGVGANSNTSGSSVISSDRVEGTDVYNGQSERLGRIDDLVIDKQSGQVRYALE
jgi:hypothetical protein